VMKATDLRERNDLPASWGFHLASMGAVVVEGLMRAGVGDQVGDSSSRLRRPHRQPILLDRETVT
jgi:hypothetical protein